MGTYIYTFVEIKTAGKWQRIDKDNPETRLPYTKQDYPEHQLGGPFSKQDYNVFSFLGGVRKEGKEMESLAAHRGFPSDSEYLNGFYLFDNEIDTPQTILERWNSDPDVSYQSWVSLKELLAFNYSKTFLYGREGEKRQIRSYREVLGELFFRDLDTVKSIGDPENIRIIFWFD